MSLIVNIGRWERMVAMHHCAVCKSIVKHPEALRTCLGPHCSICARYHPLFHYVGKSHQCKACAHGRQLREERLRSIATLIGQLARLESDSDWSVVRSSKPTKNADRIRLNVVKPSLIDAVRNAIAALSDDEHKKEVEFEEIMRTGFSSPLARDEGFLRSFLVNYSTTEQLNLLVDGVLAALDVSEPSGSSNKKESVAGFTTLRATIFEVFDVAARDVVEYRKRRVSFALFITSDASDKMESELIDWDHVTGEKKTTNQRRTSNDSSEDTGTVVSSETEMTTPELAGGYVSRLLANQRADSRTGGRAIGKASTDIGRPSTPPANPVADSSVAFWRRLNWIGRSVGAQACAPLHTHRASPAQSRLESTTGSRTESKSYSRAHLTDNSTLELDYPSPCPAAPKALDSVFSALPTRLANKRRIQPRFEMAPTPSATSVTGGDILSTPSKMTKIQGKKVQPKSSKRRPTIILDEHRRIVSCNAKDPLAHMDPTINIEGLLRWPGKGHWFEKR